MILDVFPDLGGRGWAVCLGIPRSQGTEWVVGTRAGGRYRLIMSCIDRERFVFMNEPAHSWPQLSVQQQSIAEELQEHGLWPKKGVCVSRCSVIMTFPVHDFLTRFPNLRNPLNIAPGVE